MNHILANLLAVSCVASASAQVDIDYLHARSATIPFSLTTAQGGAPLTARVHGQVGLSASVFEVVDSAGTVLATANLPFQRLGVVRPAGRSADGKAAAFLVAGITLDPTTARFEEGRLCTLLAKSTATGLSITVGTPGILGAIDPIDVVRHSEEGRYYVIDGLSGNLLVAADHVDPTLFPDPSSFAIALDSTSPVLADLGAIHLVSLSAQRHQPGVLLASRARTAGAVRVQFAGGSWTSVSAPANDGFPLRAPALVDSWSPIDIRIPAGAADGSWQILDDGGQPIASGANPIGQWSTIAPPSEFGATPGQRFTIEFPGSGDSVYVHPRLRHGDPASTSTDFEVGCGLVRSEIEWPGPTFGHGVGIRSTLVQNGHDGPVQLSLAFAVRDPVNGDPLTWIDPDTAVLDTASVLSHTVPAAEIGRSVGLAFPVPNAPEWADRVLLFQYWFSLPDGQVAISDVFGGVTGGTAVARVGAPELSLGHMPSGTAAALSPSSARSLRDRIIDGLAQRGGN